MHSVPGLTVTDMHNHNTQKYSFTMCRSQTSRTDSPFYICVGKCTSQWFPERLLGSQSPTSPLDAAGPGRTQDPVILTPNRIPYNSKIWVETPFPFHGYGPNQNRLARKMINKHSHLIGSSKASHSGWDVPDVWVRQLRNASVLRGSKEKITGWNIFLINTPRKLKCFQSDYSSGMWILRQPWSKHLMTGDHNWPTIRVMACSQSDLGKTRWCKVGWKLSTIQKRKDHTIGKKKKKAETKKGECFYNTSQNPQWTTLRGIKWRFYNGSDSLLCLQGVIVARGGATRYQVLRVAKSCWSPFSFSVMSVRRRWKLKRWFLLKKKENVDE